MTTTAFSAWRNGRYPVHAQAVRRRLEARQLEHAPPSEYVWFMGTGGVLVDEESLRTTQGRHHVIHAATLPPAQMRLARLVLTVEPGDRYWRQPFETARSAERRPA